MTPGGASQEKFAGTNEVFNKFGVMATGSASGESYILMDNLVIRKEQVGGK